MNFLWISIISGVLLQKCVFSQESDAHGHGLKRLRGGPGGPRGGPHAMEKCCKIQNSTGQTELRETFKGYMDDCHQQIGIYLCKFVCLNGFSTISFFK